jgi:hypothetical protein
MTQNMILLSAIVATILATGCTEEYGERCNGQTIESWRSGNLSSGRWEPGTSCSEDKGEVCKVFDASSPIYPHYNRAFCVSRAPVPACKGMTGRFCAANNSLLTCINGFRIARPLSYFDSCPTSRPHCYESAPGVAFCVKDPNPSSLCTGKTPRPMEYCAAGSGTCRQADVIQYCADATTSVTCLGGVLLEEETCRPNNPENSATCVETTSVEGGSCTYTSASP